MAIVEVSLIRCGVAELAAAGPVAWSCWPGAGGLRSSGLELLAWSWWPGASCSGPVARSWWLAWLLAASLAWLTGGDGTRVSQVTKPHTQAQLFILIICARCALCGRSHRA